MIRVHLLNIFVGKWKLHPLSIVSKRVLLKIKVKNENGRHYFSLDSSEYTLYPDEEEVLLQAGLIVQVDEVQEEKGMTIFQVHTSEKLMARNYLT